VLIDSGFTVSLVPRSYAMRLGLTMQATRRFAYGIGGMSTVGIVRLDELKINQSTRRDYQVYTSGDRDFGADIGFVLGEDFLAQLDVEFDLSHNAVRLFQTKDCGDKSLAYWAPDEASEVPIERVGDFYPQIVLTIEINGQRVKAQLDSGAAVSALTSPQRRFWALPGNAGCGRSRQINRIGALRSTRGTGRLSVVGSGEKSGHHNRFAITTAALLTAAMLLGMDFLLSSGAVAPVTQIYFLCWRARFSADADPGIPRHPVAGGR
jgi:predicted aspartyl protease